MKCYQPISFLIFICSHHYVFYPFAYIGPFILSLLEHEHWFNTRNMPPPFILSVLFGFESVKLVFSNQHPYLVYCLAFKASDQSFLTNIHIFFLEYFIPQNFLVFFLKNYIVEKFSHHTSNQKDTKQHTHFYVQGTITTQSKQSCQCVPILDTRKGFSYMNSGRS